METSRKCLSCEEAGHVHLYPCGRTFCHKCIVEFNYAKLKVFRNRLENDFRSFKNEASFLACLEDCGRCKVSMSVETLQSFLEHSDLTAGDKEEFRRLSTIGRSYFSGLKTNFFRCLNCDKFWYYREKLPFLCTQCVCDMLAENTSFQAKVIYFNWTNDPGQVLESDWMGRSFFVLKYDEINETYFYDPATDEFGAPCHRVTKLRNIRSNESFLIVRAWPMDISNEDFLVIDNNVQDIKLICLASALPKTN